MTPKSAQGPKPPTVRILGLDPSSVATGFGVVGLGRAGAPRLLAAGTIRPPRGADMGQKLDTIYSDLSQIIEQYQPTECAVEGVFAAKNVKTAIVLGQARGVAMLAAGRAGLAVFEYSPATVKKALVGVGRASKEQVRAMVQTLIKTPIPGGLDASDALAVAICHLNCRALIPGRTG